MVRCFVVITPIDSKQRLEGRTRPLMRITLGVIVLLDNVLGGARSKKDLRTIREHGLHSIVRIHGQLLDHVWILVHG